MAHDVEAETRAKAKRLGIALPEWRMCEYPSLFSSWADRVAQADLLRVRGKLTDADLDECDRQIGVAASRVRKPDAVAYRAPGFAKAFAEDPLRAIAKAVGAFQGAAS